MDFDGTEVLKNISFEIAEGEILGIIGRSGAGKTVLMHLMRGVDSRRRAGRSSITSRLRGCGSVDVAEPGGEALPACGGTYAPMDIDLWNEKDETSQARGHAPDRDHVPADLCPVRR